MKIYLAGMNIQKSSFDRYYSFFKNRLLSYYVNGKDTQMRIIVEKKRKHIIL